MAQVNRYSRPEQIAKFDPMTAEDIMAVPLLKQEMEDTQIATHKEALKELFNTKTVGADAARINAQKTELETELMDLSSDISSRGISRQRTDRFNGLRTKYDKALSISGDIGHANAFVAKRDLAKQNFYATAMKNDWPKDDADRIWKEHEASQSAFDGDTYVTDYAEKGLPKYLRASEMLKDAAKSLGYSKVRGVNGIDVKSNQYNVERAAHDLLVKFQDPTTAEGRLAKEAGWTMDSILEELRDTTASMLVYEEDHSNNDAMEKADRAARLKAQQEALEASTISEARVWEMSYSTINSAGIPTSKAKADADFSKMEKDIAAYRNKGDYGSAQEVEQQYLRAKELEDLSKESYANTTQGVNLQKAIDSVVGKNKDFFDAIERGAEPDNTSKGLRIKTTSETKTDADGKVTSKEVYSYVTPAQMAEYNKVKTTYDDAYYQMVGGDNSHMREKEMVWQESSDKATKDSQAEYVKAVQNGFEVSSGEFQIESVSSLIEGMKGPMEGFSVNRATGEKDEDVVKKHKMLFNIMSQNKDDIKVVSQVPGNPMHAPGVRVQFTVPLLNDAQKKNNKDIYGGMEGQVLDMVVSVNLENPNQETSGKALMTQKLKGTTIDGARLAKNNSDWYKYHDFHPSSTDNGNYYNDTDIQAYVSPRSIFSDSTDKDGKVKPGFLGKGDRADIYKEEGTNLYKFKKLTAAGITDTLSYREMLRDIDINTGDGILQWMVTNPNMAALVAQKFERDPEFLRMDSGEKKKYVVQQIVALKNSDEEVEAQQFQTFLNIL
jgi:hypothetical protein